MVQREITRHIWRRKFTRLNSHAPAYTDLQPRLAGRLSTLNAPEPEVLLNALEPEARIPGPERFLDYFPLEVGFRTGCLYPESSKYPQ